MCKTCGGSIDHLFLHCEVATKMWSALLLPFGVAWVMPRKVSELLGSWRGQSGNCIALYLWRMALLCLMWCLWRERNACNFDDCEFTRFEEVSTTIPVHMESGMEYFACFYFFLNF